MKQERFHCSTECSTVVWWKSIGERVHRCGAETVSDHWVK